MTPSAIEPATFRLIAQCLNQLRHRVPQDFNGAIGNVVLVNSDSHNTPKNFSENYPQFGHAPSDSVASPVLNRKRFKEYRF